MCIKPLLPSYLFVVHSSLSQSRPPWCCLALFEREGCSPVEKKKQTVKKLANFYSTSAILWCTTRWSTICKIILSNPCKAIINSSTVLIASLRFNQSNIIFLSYDAGQYRFEVAVDYLLPVQHLQAPQKCMSETPDKGEAEALEVVFFYELVQVHPRWRKNVWRLVISSRWRHIKKLRLAERFYENTLSMSKCTQCGFTYKKMLLK